MAEGEEKDTMADVPEEHTDPADQGESRLRWRKRDDSRGAHAADGQGTAASGNAQQAAGATLTEDQRRLVEQAVQERLATEQAKVEEASVRIQRVQADFANYKRRSEQEREQQARFASLLLITELLPVMDNFDRALSTMPEEVRNLPWAEGVLLVDRQLRGTLERQGLKPIEAMGSKFDPMLHEAIIHEESTDHADDEVIAELQRGYMLHDRVVRPTLVKVAKNHS